ncbi:MAG: hypothetical protein ACF8GE_07045 [Phycisphaerales bacterium JB043]
MASVRLAPRLGLIVAFFLGAGLVGLFVLPGVDEAGRGVVGGALIADLVLVGPLLAYLLVVRARRLTALSVIPFVIVGYVLASVTLPSDMRGGLRVVELALMPVELGVIAYVMWCAQRIVRRASGGEGDIVTRFRASAMEVLGVRRVADVLTSEVMVVWFLVCGRAKGMECGAGFTHYRDAGYPRVLGVLGVVMVVEIFAMHLLLGLWSDVAAWIVTGLSVYGAIWLAGDFRALRSRRTRVDGGWLRLRVGLRWEADVPLERVLECSRLPGALPEREKGVALLIAFGQPTVRIVFDEPVELLGMCGIRRRASEAWLGVDDPGRFCEQLSSAMADKSG